MVTAELAAALPVMAFFALALAWLLGLAVSQGQVMAAAREGARVAARGDSVGLVVVAVQRTAPGSSVQVDRSGGLVSVVVRRQRQPIPSLSGLGMTVSWRAVAAIEPGAGS